jgi:hypothetical protein
MWLHHSQARFSLTRSNQLYIFNIFNMLQSVMRTEIQPPLSTWAFSDYNLLRSRSRPSPFFFNEYRLKIDLIDIYCIDNEEFRSVNLVVMEFLHRWHNSQGSGRRRAHMSHYRAIWGSSCENMQKYCHLYATALNYIVCPDGKQTQYTYRKVLNRNCVNQSQNPNVPLEALAISSPVNLFVSGGQYGRGDVTIAYCCYLYADIQ